jgi:zinc and cadmium transporter
MAITLSAFCLAILTVSILGGLLPLATVLNHTRLQVYLSFSAGTMLGAAFFHMMPEAIRVGSIATIHWAAFGLLALFFLERFFSFHHHEPHAHGPVAHRNAEGVEDGNHESGPDCTAAGSSANSSPGTASAVRALPWGSAAFGLVIHSLVGGVALASAVAADFKIRSSLGSAGLGVFIATLVHKPADALTITSLMLRGRSSRRAALLVNFGFGLMIPAGVAFFALGMGGFGSNSSSWTASALAFSAGTFLCIALSDLLPELQFHSQDRLKLSVALLTGFALMAATAAIDPTEQAAVAPAHQAQAVPSDSWRRQSTHKPLPNAISARGLWSDAHLSPPYFFEKSQYLCGPCRNGMTETTVRVFAKLKSGLEAISDQTHSRARTIHDDALRLR